MDINEQQIRFLEIYNEYNDFYLELEENMSNSLTIICNVHELLEMFFDMYESDEFNSDVKEYLLEKDNLNSAIDFLEYRTKLVKALYDEYDFETFEELSIVLYFKCSLEEIKKIYESHNLTKHKNYVVINDRINLMDEYLKNGIYLNYDEYNEMDIELNSYYEKVKNEPLQSMLLFAMYECLIDEEEKDLDNEEVLLEFLNEHVSFLVKNVSIEYGDKILDLSKDNLIRKKFIELKDILDNVNLILDFFYCELEDLNEELKMDFSFTVSFIGSLFMACVHLFFDEYSYLDVKNLSKDDQKKLLLFINFYGIQLFLEGMSEMDIEKDNVEELLNEILDKNISYEEYALELNQLEQIFLKQSNIEYNTIDEYVIDVKVKLSHFANIYH